MLNKDYILSLTKTLYDYSNLSLLPQAADILIVMGTNDLGVARHAAQIDQRFSYPLIFVSGGVSHQLSLRKEAFGGMEAEIMSRAMIEMGVDSAKIFLENGAKNTGDNIILSRTLLSEMGKEVKTGHLVHTPTMQRRALATAEKQWPEVRWSISSENLPFENYVAGLDEKRFIDGLVGDVFRILDYPPKGFQTAQAMPDCVRKALHTLIIAGFNRRIPEDFEAVLARP